MIHFLSETKTTSNHLSEVVFYWKSADFLKKMAYNKGNYPRKERVFMKNTYKMDLVRPEGGLTK